MRRILPLSALLVLSAAVSAQETHPWTLRECTERALAYNIGLKQQENTLAQREIDLDTAEKDRLPSVSASASENLSFGRGLTADNTYANTNTTSTSLSLGTGINLFNGFRVRNGIELSRLNLEAATADLEKARDDIRVAVAQGYMQILYNMEIRDVARRQVAIDSVQVVRLGALSENGKASRAEVAQQEAALARSRSTLTQAENSLRLATLELAQLLELPSPEGFAVVRPALDGALRLLESPEDIYAAAVEVKPAVKAEALRLEGSERSVDIARSGLYPSLSLSGGIGSNYYTTSMGVPQSNFWDQLSTNFSQYVGVSLNIPIFNKFATRNQIRSAQLSRDSQALRLENTKKTLFKEIQQAWNSAVNAQEKYRSAIAASAAQEEAFLLMQGRYENGIATSTEFNEAKNQWLAAESDRIQAACEALFQGCLLEFYKDGTLSF